MPGTVNFADWSLSWSIPNLTGEGLRISSADFKGTRVLYLAGAPFVLVPYHGNSPTFKDGLGPAGGGLPFTAVKPTAPNRPSWLIPPSQVATNDNQYDPVANPGGAVMIERTPADLLEPARVDIWAKLQCGNYQYVHRWVFHADGAIHAEVGLGGRLLTFNPPTMGHIHNFYFRLDFDVAGFSNNLVQRFAHKGNNPGDDQWLDINFESKETADPNTFTKWRVLNKTPKPNGLFRSYEISPGSDGAPDGIYTSASTYSRGDLWVVLYKGDTAETGADVGVTDDVLTTNYANGEAANGQDLVVWHCLRHHHQPRQLGEETIVVPYEFLSFHMAPRDFVDGTITNLYPTTPPSP
jgi:primary-amine oxidase